MTDQNGSSTDRSPVDRHWAGSSDVNDRSIVPIGRRQHTQKSSEHTIQLLLGDEGNRTAVAKLLADRYDVVDGPPLQDADLFLIENRMFPEYRDALREQIERHYPVFVPVVVICRPSETPLFTTTESVQNGELLVVDDVLAAPLTRQQLRRRLHSLLVRREQSRLHRERERRIEHLLDATRKVMETTDRDEVVQFTADVTKHILGFASNVVRLVDDNRLEPAGVTEEANVSLGNRPAYPLDADDNPAARAFVQQESLIYDDLISLDDGYDRGAAGSGMYVPIGTYGVLSIVEPRTDAFEQSDVEFASILAANAEAALDRIEFEHELQQRDLHRQILSRVLRHNLRNDLNVIQIKASQLATELDDSRAEPAETIIDVAERLLSRSENTRTISEMIEDGAAREVRDLSKVISEVAAEFREQFPSASIEVDVPSSCPIRVCEQFQVAVEQLVENAIEHNAAQDPWVCITIETDEDVRLIVEDDGPGIPDLETQPIDRSEETPLQHASGTGLWLVSWMVDASDGLLSFERTTGGTRVVIEFPTYQYHGDSS